MVYFYGGSFSVFSSYGYTTTKKKHIDVAVAYRGRQKNVRRTSHKQHTKQQSAVVNPQKNGASFREEILTI